MDTGEQSTETNETNKDNENFTSPKKTSKVPKTLKYDSVSINNRYQSLQTQIEDEATTSGSSHLAPSAGRKGTTTGNRSKGKKAPPPIHVMGNTLKNIINELLKKGIKKDKFSTKEVDANICTIYASDLECHKIIANILIELKWEYYTYTPREEKLKTLVLKGVRGGFDENDIKTEIDSLNLDEVKTTKVSKLSFNRMNTQLHHFIVQLTSDSNKTQLSNVKTILNQRVTWENLKRKNIFQCRNCQRVGHSSSNCHLTSRCVKCAGNHPHGECSLDKAEPKSKLTCANCGEQGHPASYMGCPYLKMAQDLKKNNYLKRQETKRSTIIRQASFVRPNTSYASLLHTTVEGRPRLTASSSQPMVRGQNTYHRVQATNVHIENNRPNIMNSSEHEQNIINKLINKLKDELTAAITTQFMELDKKISANTSKIEFILTQMYQNE